VVECVARSFSLKNLRRRTFPIQGTLARWYGVSRLDRQKKKSAKTTNELQMNIKVGDLRSR
jgi:hypothetical protein